MALTERGLRVAGTVAGIERADLPNYLGDTAVIDSLLRQFFNDALQRRSSSGRESPDRDAAKAADLAQVEELAGVLLGRYSGFAPQPAWNVEGGIDEWLADTLKIAEADPLTRIQTALVSALVEFYGIVNYSQQEGVLEQQWNWQVDALVWKWTKLLLGIPEAMEGTEV